MADIYETGNNVQIVEDVEEKNTCEEEVKNMCNEILIKQLVEFLTINKESCCPKSLYTFIDRQAKLCDTEDKQLELIKGGIGLLKIFILKNWTGPEIPLDEKISLFSTFDSRPNILKLLVDDGESVISTVELPEILFFSKTILEVSYNNFKNSEVAKIWYLRCLFIQQQILEEYSLKLFKKIEIIIEEIRKIIDSMEDITKSAAVAYFLEFGRIYMYYKNVQKSKEDVLTATALAGIHVSLSGALGVRTKYQQKDLSQLILKVKIHAEDFIEAPNEDISYCSLPHNVKLEDDVRLEKIKYANNEHHENPVLNGLQLAVILANLFQTQNSQPKDGLADEELQPYISYILEQPKIWSVTMATLLLRSKLEATHRRTVERTVMQIEDLTKSINETNIPLKDKFTYFFISYLSPKWVVKSTLANTYAALGHIKSALDIYQSLEEWENVIYCYNTLQMRHKAKEIIEQEIQKEETPKLWCLLGDATDDVSCYEKAWELSNRKSAKAQRHWAHFYYYRKEYAESIDHFKKSLDINSLQTDLWYKLAYASLVEEKWEISALAYRRYCALDPECFEAWNNLGRCYCELKQVERARKALQEALKIDYTNWRIWDNYMVVTTDIKLFDEAIKCYHEILNLKGKHLDLSVLRSLVLGYQISTEENAKNAEPEKIEFLIKFKTELLKLFGRLTSQICNESELWFLYSEVVDTATPENLTKKYQLLLKAHRSAVNKLDWEKNLQTCNKVIIVLSKLVEVGLLINNSDTLMSCKLAANNAIAKIKKENPEIEISQNLEENLAKINTLLDG